MIKNEFAYTKKRESQNLLSWTDEIEIHSHCPVKLKANSRWIFLFKPLELQYMKTRT